jgi:acyl-homoserine lactone acylase PvdQ
VRGGQLSRHLAGGAVLIALLALCAPAAAAPTPEPYGTNDAGGFRAVLPPGANGFVNGPQLLAFQAGGVRPAHNDDQLAPYRDLLFAAPGLAASNIDRYFHDAGFGVPPGQVERTYSPRSDVTIERDSLGVPHVYGATLNGAMFGLGYAAAEDRLFFMDALRHAGRADLSSFAGGANQAMDESVWADSPYTEADLTKQFNTRPRGVSEALFQRGREAVINYVAGINKYIAEARLDPSKMPGEYAAIGRPLGPSDWTPEDLISTAALVGGIFGKGGGRELDSALVLEQAQKRFGKRGGRRVWSDFREANDPEAPTTVHGHRFPYEVRPKHPRGTALPDPGTVRDLHEADTSARAAHRAAPGVLGELQQLYASDDPLRAGASNALLVSGREAKGGVPIAVMGPQVAYFAPQILMEEDVHAPGMDARGAAFPGVNLVVQLGRGRNYAWSATSAGQDLIDTFAVPLCDPGGGRATLHSDHYRFRGKCLPIEELTKTISWTPNLADPTPPGSETLRSERTKLGIVIARAKVHGKPVIYTKLRSTYFHETDSLLGFSQLNDPNFVKGPRSFQRAASHINYTFNWFYIDHRHIAYFNSGKNPKRAKGVDPDLPVSSKFTWRKFDPSDNETAALPPRTHPQTIDQRYLTSWNNKQAPGYRAADDNWSYGSAYRSQTLDERVRRLIRGKRRATLPQLVGAMEGAATVDLRGHTVLPYALAILRTGRIPRNLRTPMHQLTAWVRSGAHRIDRNHDGHYEHSQAIRILDTWWPLLIRAEFEPTLGHKLFDRIASMTTIDDSPNHHLGSAYNGGWYVYANKDLRTILGRRVHGRYSRVYCGHGRLRACRQDLLHSLHFATGGAPYGENAGCGVGDEQMCFDAIHFRATGGTTQPDIEWQNRPTFQQVVRVRGAR